MRGHPEVSGDIFSIIFWQVRQQPKRLKKAMVPINGAFAIMEKNSCADRLPINGIVMSAH